MTVTILLHGLDEAITQGFDALLDPAGTQLKILIDLSR